MSLFKCYILTGFESERHHHMIEKMEKFIDFDYEFVFYRKFSERQIDMISGIDKIRKTMRTNNLEYIKRAFSCADGHSMIMRKFLKESKFEYALVCEDDVILPSNIFNVVEKLVQFDSDKNHWFNLNYEASLFQDKKIDKISDSLFVKKQKNWFGTACYLASKNKISKIYQLIYPILYQADIALLKIFGEADVVYGSGVLMDEDNLKTIIGTENEHS